MRKTAIFRQAQREIVEAEQTELVELRARGAIDNTVLRRLLRIFDLELVERSSTRLSPQYATLRRCVNSARLISRRGPRAQRSGDAFPLSGRLLRATSPAP